MSFGLRTVIFSYGLTWVIELGSLHIHVKFDNPTTVDYSCDLHIYKIFK
jgi:hypothetical protein